MTDFEITPRDIGRIAGIDKEGLEWRCVVVGIEQAVFQRGDRFLVVYSGNKPETGRMVNGHARLTHWKPRTLEAPKLWWNVYRNEGGNVWGESSREYCQPVFPDLLIARIYAEHWHGCEEGRFDTPESVGAPS